MTDMLTGPPPVARWWRSLFDTSDDALVVCDQRGTTLAANPRSAHLLGLTNAGRFLPTPCATPSRQRRRQSSRPSSPARTPGLEDPERQRVAQLPGARRVNKPYDAAEAVDLIMELLTGVA